VGEQVERLEDDADVPADPIDVHPPGGDLLAVHDDAAGVDGLQEVHALEEGGFARSRGSDQTDDLVRGDRQVDAPQNLELVVRLVDVLQAECLAIPVAHRPPPARIFRC
jgi:hypothetical protein